MRAFISWSPCDGLMISHLLLLLLLWSYCRPDIDPRSCTFHLVSCPSRLRLANNISEESRRHDGTTKSGVPLDCLLLQENLSQSHKVACSEHRQLSQTCVNAILLILLG